MGGKGARLEPQMSLGGSAQEPWIIDHPWSSRKSPLPLVERDEEDLLEPVVAIQPEVADDLRRERLLQQRRRCHQPGLRVPVQVHTAGLQVRREDRSEEPMAAAQEVEDNERVLGLGGVELRRSV